MSFWGFSFSVSHLVRGTLGYVLLHPAFTWVLRFKLGDLCLHTKCFIYWAIFPSFFWNSLKISRCFRKLGVELCAGRHLPSQHLKGWAEMLRATLLGCMYGLLEQFLHKEIHTKIRTHFSISWGPALPPDEGRDGRWAAMQCQDLPQRRHHSAEAASVQRGASSGWAQLR